MKIPDRDFLDKHLQSLIDKKDVFKPFHNLPTMSLDEFADNEIQQIEVNEEKKRNNEEMER